MCFHLLYQLYLTSQNVKCGLVAFIEPSVLIPHTTNTKHRYCMFECWNNNWHQILFFLRIIILIRKSKHLCFPVFSQFIEVQPNDGFGTLLPKETLEIDLIFSANKAKKYSFQLCCKSGINRLYLILVQMNCLAYGLNTETADMIQYSCWDPTFMARNHFTPLHQRFPPILPSSGCPTPTEALPFFDPFWGHGSRRHLHCYASPDQPRRSLWPL